MPCKKIGFVYAPCPSKFMLVFIMVCIFISRFLSLQSIASFLHAFLFNIIPSQTKPETSPNSSEQALVFIMVCIFISRFLSLQSIASFLHAFLFNIIPSQTKPETSPNSSEQAKKRKVPDLPLKIAYFIIQPDLSLSFPAMSLYTCLKSHSGSYLWLRS